MPLLNFPSVGAPAVHDPEACLARIESRASVAHRKEIDNAFIPWNRHCRGGNVRLGGFVADSNILGDIGQHVAGGFLRVLQHLVERHGGRRPLYGLELRSLELREYRSSVINRSVVRTSANPVLGEEWNGIVMKPTGIGTGAYSAWDSRHACAPSVVRHNHAPLAALFAAETGIPAPPGGVYLMYYECEPQWFDSTTGVPTWITGLASICLAMSADGKRWFKWSDVNGDTYGVLREDDAVVNYPTPVIKSQEAMNLCSYSTGTDAQGRLIHRLNPAACNPNSDPGLEYGAGHPSAMIVNGSFVGVFYVNPAYDHDHGCQGLRKYFMRTSLDGIHFDTAPFSFTLNGYQCNGSAGPSIRVALGFDDLDDDGTLDSNEPTTYIVTSLVGETNRYFQASGGSLGLYPPSNWTVPHINLPTALANSLRSRATAVFATNSKGQFDLGPTGTGAREVTLWTPDYPSFVPAADWWRSTKLHRIKGKLQ